MVWILLYTLLIPAVAFALYILQRRSYRKLASLLAPLPVRHFGFGVIIRHYIPCVVCNKSVVDAGSILWTVDDQGLRDNYCHARCAVRVVQPDGGIYDVNGARLDEAVGSNSMFMYLTPAEWETFKEYAEAMKMPVDIDVVE